MKYSLRTLVALTAIVPPLLAGTVLATWALAIVWVPLGIIAFFSVGVTAYLVVEYVVAISEGRKFKL
ncbi:MAG: hypothetical protein L0211_16020 [Planctomycetaceae bacterium]|nr:hypothetical protein [Planctomycetaceae bacterium]